MTTMQTAIDDLGQLATPERYGALTDDSLAEAIEHRREQLGERLLVLAHHYQRDEIVRHADFVGDSLRLSMRAAEASQERGVKWIVFCGVSFMAETADVLTHQGISVILPNRGASCPMAAMAEADDVRRAIELLTHPDVIRERGPLVPVAYVNSTAAVKAIVGEAGGACCTSANAKAVMRSALNGGDHPGSRSRGRVLFLPDEHLGRNVCAMLGVPEDQQALWEPQREGERTSAADLRDARVIHWKGHCYVHTRFKRRDVDSARAQSLRIVVHPECTRDVVALADSAVSTETMVKMIEAAEPGSRWAIGTEAHLVQRLAREAATRDVEVRILGRRGAAEPMCGAMLHISPQDLLWSLDNLAEGREINAVRVPANARAGARLALERMLQMSV